MATFIGGSGAIGLGNDIGGIAADNGCYENARGFQVSMWEMWNLIYYFGTDFSSPYNFGFFYGQGCPAILYPKLKFWSDPYSESTAGYGLYYKATGGTETLIATLDNYGLTCGNAGAPRINTKSVGQSSNTTYVGIRQIGKPQASIEYGANIESLLCPNDGPGDYGGTADYPGSCPGQASISVSSALTSEIGITVNVDRDGYFVTC